MMGLWLVKRLPMGCEAQHAKGRIVLGVFTPPKFLADLVKSISMEPSSQSYGRFGAWKTTRTTLHHVTLVGPMAPATLHASKVWKKLLQQSRCGSLEEGLTGSSWSSWSAGHAGQLKQS